MREAYRTGYPRIGLLLLADNQRLWTASLIEQSCVDGLKADV